MRFMGVHFLGVMYLVFSYNFFFLELEPVYHLCKLVFVFENASRMPTFVFGATWLRPVADAGSFAPRAQKI